MSLSEGSEPTVDTYLSAVKSYIRSQHNPLLDRIRFFERKQELGESFDEFLASVKELQVACDFSVDEDCATCMLHQEQALRDKLVIGIRSQETRHKLLAVSPLTLADAVRISRAEEAAFVTKEGLGKSPAQVNATKKFKKFGAKNNSKNSNTAENCGSCGNPSHRNRKDCPASDIICRKCNKQGHFARWCRSKKNKEDNKVSLKEVSAGRVEVKNLCSISQVDLIQVEVRHSKRVSTLQFRDDTGSDIDAIGPKHLKAMQVSVQELERADLTVCGANSKSMKVLGKFPVELLSNNTTVNSHIYVLTGVKQPLLSKRSLKGLQYLPKDWPKSPCSANAQCNRAVSESLPSEGDIERTKQQVLA